MQQAHVAAAAAAAAATAQDGFRGCNRRQMKRQQASLVLLIRPKHGSALDGEVLHGLDQAALDVAGAGRLDRRVDQPLAAAHGVEEEFLGRQPPQVRVLHKAPRLGAVVVLPDAPESQT
jgi:hypothetical protein